MECTVWVVIMDYEGFPELGENIIGVFSDAAKAHDLVNKGNSEYLGRTGDEYYYARAFTLDTI